MITAIPRFVARRALLVLIVLLVATCVPAYFAMKGLSLHVVLEEMLPTEAKNVQLYMRFSEQFGGANTTLIEIKNKKGSIYSKEFLEKYKKVAEDVYYRPDGIRHLNQSLVLRKTKKVTGSGGSVEITAISWPDLPQTEQEMAEFRRAVNKQYRGFLVSDDETSAMVIADFKDNANFTEVLRFFTDIRAKVEDDTTSVHVVGRPILLGYIYQSLGSVYAILLISLVLVAAILYLYFRTWLGVFVPMLTATVATTWGLGVMGFIHYNLDPLLILLPVFIFAIILSHGVQLTSRVLESLETNPGRMKECTEHSLRQLLIPSTTAIVTDAAGFGVLALVAIPSIKSLALICGIWLLSVTPALIFAASVLCLIRAPKSHSRSSKLLTRLWGKIIEMEDHKYGVIGVVGGLLVLGAFYSTNLTLGDTKGSAILWPDSRYNVDVDSINTRYSRVGTDMMQVYIEGDEETMLDPAVYHRTEALDRYLFEHVPEVRPAQSLAPVIKLIHSVLYEGDPSYEIIPDSKKEVGFDLYMFRSRGEPGDFAAYTDNEWRIGNISFFLEDHSAPTIAKVTAAIGDFFNLKGGEVSKAGFLYSGGQAGLTEALNEEVHRSNIVTMLTAAVIIATCILLAYRSIGVMLILVFSLATANFITYSFMAYKGVGLNLSTLPLAALGIGLGVDYGIYITDRIREEFGKVGNVVQAIHNALLTSGNAVFITATTMIVPLLPWALFSPLKFQAEMGMLLAMLLFMNVLGSILFVPAAVAVFKPKALFRGLGENSGCEVRAAA